MSDHYWLSEAQFDRIKPHFMPSHDEPQLANVVHHDVLA
jgi:hypothetical protein